MLFNSVLEMNFTVKILYHGVCFSNKVGPTVGQINTVVLMFHFGC